MEKNWKNIGSVTRKRYDGSFVIFPSLKDAVIGLYATQINDLNYGHLRGFVPWQDRMVLIGKGDEFIFLADGVVIPVWKVKEAFYNIPLSEYAEKRYSGCSPRFRRLWGLVDFKFRDGPVSGIRNYRRNHNRNANVQTTQEIRENDFLDHFDEDAREYGVKSRPNRGHLPTAWDDRPNGSYFQTNWKHFRKHQWKSK